MFRGEKGIWDKLFWETNLEFRIRDSILKGLRNFVVKNFYLILFNFVVERSI